MSPSPLALCLVALLAPHAAEPTAPRRAPAAPAETDIAAEIWRNPDFQRRFVESYLAESDIEPRVTSVEREQLVQIGELLAAEKHDKAITQLEKYRQGQGSAMFDFILANLMFQREEIETARAAYDVAVQKHPKFLRAWRNLGMLLSRANEPKLAVEALTHTIQLGGGESSTYGLLGAAYLLLDNPLPAETAFRMANLLDPTNANYKLGLARCLFKLNKYAEAAAFCGNLAAEQPDKVELWMLQANAFILQDQPLRAAENFELLDRMGASTFETLSALGDIYVNTELFSAGVSSHLRALELNLEASPSRALVAAKNLVARGELAETKRLVEGLTALRPTGLTDEQRKELLKIRARIAIADGAGDEEASILEEIVALDPLDGEALILLGQHADRNQDPERAIFWYERAASIEKYEADAKVRHAQTLVRQKRYAEALPLLRRAQSLRYRENIQEYLEQVESISKSR